MLTVNTFIFGEKQVRTFNIETVYSKTYDKIAWTKFITITLSLHLCTLNFLFREPSKSFIILCENFAKCYFQWSIHLTLSPKVSNLFICSNSNRCIIYNIGFSLHCSNERIFWRWTIGDTDNLIFRQIIKVTHLKI